MSTLCLLTSPELSHLTPAPCLNKVRQIKKEKGRKQKGFETISLTAAHQMDKTDTLHVNQAAAPTTSILPPSALIGGALAAQVHFSQFDLQPNRMCKHMTTTMSIYGGDARFTSWAGLTHSTTFKWRCLDYKLHSLSVGRARMTRRRRMKKGRKKRRRKNGVKIANAICRW